MNSLMKKAALASALSFVLPTTAMADIIITEYVEGSSSNKAIEITNMGSAAVDMGAEAYKLAMYSNGSTTEHDERFIALTGTLAAGASYIVYNSSAADEFKFPDNGAESTVTFYNGDDVIVLVKGDVITDSIGTIGERPDGGWSDANDANFSTLNKTLRRKDGITTGDADATDAFPGADNQWITFDQDTSDGLGCAGQAACSGDSGTPTVNENILITEYVEGSGSNKVVEITNMGSDAVDMGAGKYRLHLYSGGSSTPHEDRFIDLTGMLAAGASYMVYNESGDAEFQFPDNGATSMLTFFNGDDGIVLSRDGVVMDSFGQMNDVDPGAGWTDPNNADWSTQNKTLRRKASVTAGDTVIDDDFPGSDNQWLAFDINTADGLGCAGETACGAEPVVTENILITEYVEGSSSNKAVEITNMGSEAVDMSAGKYRLHLYSGGSSTPHDDRFIDLTGMLAAGASYIVYNENAAAQFQFPDNGAISSLTFFNGDDGIVLSRDGVVMDSFGQMNDVDPGDGWTDANNADWSTQNKTLRRMASVTSGDTVIDDAFPGSPNQWLVFDVDTADGLGCAGEIACSEIVAGGVVITEYVEGSGSNKAVEISNLGSEPVDLGAGNYKLAMFRDGSPTEHEDRKIFLTGMLDPGKSFVVFNESADPEFQFPEGMGAASSVTFYNGNDALVLTANDVIIDVFGRVGENPDGGAWVDPNNADFSTAEKTLRRKNSVNAGDTVADDAFPGDVNQWAVFGADVADGLGCPGENACTDDGGEGPAIPEPIENYLLITEYVEGSSSNKAIELSNVGANDIDLFTMGYRLEAYNNGSTRVSNALNLFGLLPSGSSVVIHNNDAVDEAKKDAPQGIGSNVTFFNGDDAIVLTLGGVVVDSIGRIGQRPNNEWTDATDPTFGTQNKTIRRKADVMVGDHIANDVFPISNILPGATNQWLTFETDTFDGLGCMGELACTGSEPVPTVGAGGGVAIGACVNCPEISKVGNDATFDDATYYADVMAASRADLATALNLSISARHVPLTYGQVWSVLTFSDEDPDNTDNIIELYTGNSIAKLENGSGPNANNQDSWNREHVWSKSHGFPDEAQLGYTDAHHLRPADWSMNTLRSNLDFDNGGDAVEESPMNYKDGDSWEPRDEVKGDVARMMFYMDTRYNGADESMPDLVLVNEITDSATVDGVAKFGVLCTLWDWHKADPVSAMEMQRNAVVYEYQGNRNPFIDHPFFGDQLFGDACTMPVIHITGPSVVNEGDTVTVDASGTTDVDPANLMFHWRQTTGALIQFQYDAKSISFTAPKVSGDIPISFELTVSDGTNTVTETFSLVVEDTSDSSSVGGTVGFISLLLLPLVGLRRRRK